MKIRVITTLKNSHSIKYNYYPQVNIMNSCDLTASVTAFANAISTKLSIEEITLLAAVLVQLGDTLVTIATHRGLTE